MDWCFDPEVGNVGDLRREIRSHLQRHAEHGADIDGAELVVAEILANAVEHASGLIWVELDWAQPIARLAVHDLGADFEVPASLPSDPRATSGRGLFIATQLSGALVVAAKAGRGKKVVAELPVRRPPEADHSPPRRRSAALPLAGEANETGFFDRESFLRALVVQVAETVELHQGPSAVEQVIAQVGTDVGGRMEDEFRRARDLEGALTPEQLAEFYVGLKAAIGGDFYVIEVTADRIVLGNRACPFGDVVQRAPGLCRMTSSVFGSAAARAGQTVSVALEERIAIGDPECRVVVYLTPPPEETLSISHTYS
jgi:anti-sigma regulatory factor (Ser/Thr protein kinase)/predicted ArsR family transcriptional regulator